MKPYDVEHGFELILLLILFVYQACTWIALTGLQVMLFLYHLTPASWPAFPKLLIYPALTYVLRYAWLAIRR